MMKKFSFSHLNKPLLIAEIGNNHEGSFKRAKKLIDLAKQAGADAVKFQTINPEKFHHKDEKSFNEFSKNTEKTYRECFKFPPKMFSNTELIDFGAGTGHNTISLANWGAKCTLVELSDKSLGIAKEVFKLRAKNLSDHKFINSSIFLFNKNFL